MVEANATPARRKVANSDQRVTSPYFSQVGKDEASLKLKRRNSGEAQPTIQSTPARRATPRNEMRLTTSPYFSNTKTPSPRYAVPSTGARIQETSQESGTPRRKRQRLILRGETPDEPLPPPATSKELSQVLGGIKPQLIQEIVRDDPWKIVVATTLLNKTSGKAAIPVFWKLIERWPTPLALAQAAAPSLTALLQPLGTQSVRTSRLIRLSNAYTMHPPVLPLVVRLEDGSQSPRVSSEDFDRCVTGRSSSASSSSSNILPFSDTRAGGTPTDVTSDQISPPFHTLSQLETSTQSTKEYTKAQKSSPIAHIPFTGPYAIDSFRIFSSSLPGGGAPSRVEEQLERIARLAQSVRRPQDNDFDETPEWYDPGALRVTGDEDTEWRKVRPADKELRRYLVWRWAIEGVAYDPEKQFFRPADWNYLNGLIRR